MSWEGKHPVLTKEEARKLLPPGRCKRCVYYTRCFPVRIIKNGHLMNCSRCTTWDGAFFISDHWGTPNLTPRRERFSENVMYRKCFAKAHQK